MNINKIGNIITEQRIAKNLTQEQLAEKLGVLRTTISKWERGINTPDISLLQPLCQELDLTFTELINGEKNIDKETRKGERPWSISWESTRAPAASRRW